MAAPLIDNSTTKTELGTSTSTVSSFAVSGSNRVLYVGVMLSAGSPPAVSNVTWNGSESLTQIYDSGVVQSFLRLVVYRLIAPSATTASIVVNLAASCSEWIVIPVSVKDCDQTTPNGAPTGANGDTIADTLVTVSSATGKLVLDFIGRFADILNVGSGQTSVQTVYNSPMYGGSSTEAGASSVGMAWASPSSGTPLNWNWVQVGFSLNDVSAGGTLIGHVTETDTAQAMTVIGPISASIGQVSETDVAQPLTVVDFAEAGDLFYFGDTSSFESAIGGLRVFGGSPAAAGSTVALGQVTETDTAQALTRSLSRSIGQIAETDTAQAMVVRLSLVVGQPAETDTAQPLTSRLTLALGQVSETDTAQPVSAGGALVLGQVQEVDAAQPLTAAFARVLAQASETDTAQPLSLVTGTALGQVTETDTAQPLSARFTAALAQVVESDTAQPLTAVVQRAIGQPAETDAAQAMSTPQARQVAQVDETDTAQPLAALGPVTLGIGAATENDTAGALVAPLAVDELAIGRGADDLDDRRAEPWAAAQPADAGVDLEEVAMILAALAAEGVL